MNTAKRVVGTICIVMGAGGIILAIATFFHFMAVHEGDSRAGDIGIMALAMSGLIGGLFGYLPIQIGYELINSTKRID